MAKKKTRCYIYIRVSTEMQVEGFSLDAQRDKLIKYAEYKDFEIVREYCDAGKSGKSVTGRPQFMQMMGDIETERDKDIAFVLVFKLSRFGRNAADVLNSLQILQDYGANLICVEDGIDSSKDSGKLTITVLSAVAEIERENILVQTMEGRKQKAREGKWNGGRPPYGYDLDVKNSCLVINEEEAEVVRIIFDKYIHTDMGAESIASYLNEHGYKKNKHFPRDLDYFGTSTIKRILVNPIYNGKMAYGRHTMEKVKGTRDQYRRVDCDDYMVVDGIHDAIIDDEVWKSAKLKHAALGHKWEKRYSLEHEHILSGLIKCPVCGSGMTGSVSRRHNKETGEYKDDFYYRCHSRKKYDGEHFCSFKKTFNQKKVEAEMKNLIALFTWDKKSKDFISQMMKDRVDIERLEQEKEQLMAQLKQVIGAKNKLTEMLDNLDVNDKHYNRKYADMSNRLDDLYDKIDDIEQSIDNIDITLEEATAQKVTAKEIYKILANFDKLYDKMNDIEKKKFFHTLLEKVEVHDTREKQSDGIIKKVVFKFPVFIDGQLADTAMLTQKSTVETVCLLSKLHEAKHHVNVKLDMDEMDLTAAERR